MAKCPNLNCNFTYKADDNMWGKICPKCGEFIPASSKFINKNDDISKKNKRKLVNYVRKFLRKSK